MCIAQAVQGLPADVEALAAGAYHALAVTAGGRLWAWGRNAEGQLGPRSGVDPTAEVRPKALNRLQRLQRLSHPSSRARRL